MIPVADPFTRPGPPPTVTLRGPADAAQPCPDCQLGRDIDELGGGVA